MRRDGKHSVCVRILQRVPGAVPHALLCRAALPAAAQESPSSVHGIFTHVLPNEFIRHLTDGARFIVGLHPFQPGTRG